jgi:hypothetical protein
MRLMNAALLARSSGAAEIGVKELLAVTATDFTPSNAAEPTDNGPFVPIPKYGVAFSTAAAAAIARAGGLEA